jgi:hypothetical protein
MKREHENARLHPVIDYGYRYRCHIQPGILLVSHMGKPRLKLLGQLTIQHCDGWLGGKLEARGLLM